MQIVRPGTQEEVVNPQPGRIVVYPQARLLIRDIGDALGSVERILTVIRDLEHDPIRLQRSQRHLELAKEELEQIANWVQNQIVQTWNSTSHPARKRRKREDARQYQPVYKECV